MVGPASNGAGTDLGRGAASDPQGAERPRVHRIEHTLDVRGVETHLSEAGPPDAPALLYLHGTFLGNLWLESYRLLAERCHLYALDIPGFGLSKRPEWMRDMSDYVLYLRDALDMLDLRAPVVVGHSLGGWMALELAVWYPERVSRLVLSNAAGIRVKGTLAADLFRMNPSELLATCFDDLSAAAPLMPAEVNVEYLLDQYRQRTTAASLYWNPHYDPKLERRLERVTCPTLILWGEHDRLIPPVYGERLHERIAGSRLVVLSGTGHMPMFEQPAEWARHVVAFATGAGENASEGEGVGVTASTGSDQHEAE